MIDAGQRPNHSGGETRRQSASGSETPPDRGSGRPRNPPTRSPPADHALVLLTLTVGSHDPGTAGIVASPECVRRHQLRADGNSRSPCHDDCVVYVARRLVACPAVLEQQSATEIVLTHVRPLSRDHAGRSSLPLSSYRAITRDDPFGRPSDRDRAQQRGRWIVRSQCGGRLLWAASRRLRERWVDLQWLRTCPANVGSLRSSHRSYRAALLGRVLSAARASGLM